MAVAPEAGPSNEPRQPTERKLSLVPPLPPENGQDATTHLNTDLFAEELANAKKMSRPDQRAHNTRYKIREAVRGTGRAMTELEQAVAEEKDKNKYFDPLMQAELKAAKSLTADQIRAQNKIAEAKKRIDTIASSGTAHDLTHIRETAKRIQNDADKLESDWMNAGDTTDPNLSVTPDVRNNDDELDILLAEAEQIRVSQKNEQTPVLDSTYQSPEDGLRASLDDVENRRTTLQQTRLDLQTKLDKALSKKGFFGSLIQSLRGVDTNTLKQEIVDLDTEIGNLTKKANTLREKLNFKPLRDVNTTSRPRSTVTDYRGEGPGVSRMTDGLTRSAGSIEGSQNPKRLQTDPNLLKLSHAERGMAMKKAARDAEDELYNKAA